ncbi:UNVERIFIED_ORG: cohesin domain-containing protein [Shinella sp. XGS7]|jgi:hypothetical protein|nr:cohesin domain-containing protein [Shinella sp. XGS7]
MKAKFLTLGLLVASLLGGAAQASVVSLSPSSQSVLLGQSFTVDLNISGLSSSEIVSTFDLNIYFAPGVLSGTSFTLGSGLGGAWDASLSVVQSDNFDLFAFSLEYDPLRSMQDNDDALAALQADGGFTLATLSFDATGLGVSQLSFGSGPNERDVVGRDAEFLRNISFQGACVAVNAQTGGNNSCATVPEPSSYGLTLAALLAAGWAAGCSRRSRPSASQV